MTYSIDFESKAFQILKFISKFLLTFILLTNLIYIFFEFFYIHFSNNINNYLIFIDMDKKHDCSKFQYIDINKDELIVKNSTIEKGFSHCTIERLKNKKRLILDLNHGGNSIEALYLGYFINFNNIEVLPLKDCISACSTIYFSSNYGLYCENTKIRIHQARIINSNKNYSELYIDEKIKNFVLLVHSKKIFTSNNKNFNFSYYREIYNKTPSYKLYTFTESEILKNGFSKTKVDCSYYYKTLTT